jgi:hypothetical protein
MTKTRTAARTRELPFVVFSLFLVLFSWPLVRVVDVATRPCLAAVYFFSVWILSALVLYGVARSLRRRLDDPEDKV